MAEGKKGFWDIVGVVASIVTPLLVWYYGTRVEDQVKERQGEETMRVSRATLMQTLIPALSDTSTLKRETAFEALLYAFPPSSKGDLSPFLLQVQRLEQDARVRAYFWTRLFEAT